MLRRILVGVYNNSNLIVLLWVVFSFVLTIKFNFESCIVENDLHNVFDILFLLYVNNNSYNFIFKCIINEIK